MGLWRHRVCRLLSGSIYAWLKWWQLLLGLMERCVQIRSSLRLIWRMTAPITFWPTTIIILSILRPWIWCSAMWSSQRRILLISWLTSWVKMEVSCVITIEILLRLSNLWCCLGPRRKGWSETSLFLMLLYRNRTTRALPSWSFFRHNTFARSKLLLSLILQSIAESISTGLVAGHFSKLPLLHGDLSFQLLMSSLDPGLCITVSIWAGYHSLCGLRLENSELFLLWGAPLAFSTSTS